VNRKRIGVLAGAFNPVTRAHVELVEAALKVVDEAVCVVPRTYPHKEFHGASLEHRVEMLRLASNLYRVELTEGGLFIDIARELGRAQPESEIYFICGRDSAERIVTWEYGDPGALENMFEQFHLLVAARQGAYNPPEHLQRRIHSLSLPRNFDEVSSTEIRRRISANEPWEDLVPEPIVDLVRGIYSS
jgi:nicotinate-nucleotide adenylyltransferase